MPATIPVHTADASDFDIKHQFQPYKLYNIVKRLKHHVIMHLKTKCKRLARAIKLGNKTLYEMSDDVERYFQNVLASLKEFRDVEKLTDKEAAD